MGDRIYIKDLLLRTIVGINEEERTKRQDVLINIVLETDLTEAGSSDAIEDAVNYRTLTKRIIAMVEASRFQLVETMAAEIVELCLWDARVRAARVRVEKPGALRFARSVGVEIFRTQEDMVGRPHRVFVSLGSNIDPERNLRAAVQRLRECCKVLKVSPVYETAPVGKLDQANFLNAAALLETSLSPRQLKQDILRTIETELGRVRTEDKNAPRTIDLDIALFDHTVQDIEGWRIPDPDILRYAHVAVPLADLAPERIHPETGQTLTEIAEGFSQLDLNRRKDVIL